MCFSEKKLPASAARCDATKPHVGFVPPATENPELHYPCGLYLVTDCMGWPILVYASPQRGVHGFPTTGYRSDAGRQMEVQLIAAIDSGAALKSRLHMTVAVEAAVMR